MKKFLSCALAATMMLSLSNVAFASENTNDSFKEAGTVSVQVNTRSMDNATVPAGALAVTSDDGFKEAATIYVTPEVNTLDNASSPFGALPATAQDMAEANQTPDENAPENENMETRASWIYLDNTFYVYNQTTSYNCGPASVQAALNYLKGSSPIQSSIASGCGTTSSGTYLSDMKTYINKQQSARTYVSKYNASSSTMKSSLYSGVVSYDAPSIIGLSFSSSDGWLYSSGGHFMTVYGTKSDKSSFALGDPWIGYSGSGLSDNSWSYSKSASTIYNAYSNNNIGLMY